MPATLKVKNARDPFNNRLRTRALAFGIVVRPSPHLKPFQLIIRARRFSHRAAVQCTADASMLSLIDAVTAEFRHRSVTLF